MRDGVWCEVSCDGCLLGSVVEFSSDIFEPPRASGWRVDSWTECQMHGEAAAAIVPARDNAAAVVLTAAFSPLHTLSQPSSENSLPLEITPSLT